MRTLTPASWALFSALAMACGGKEEAEDPTVDPEPTDTDTGTETETDTELRIDATYLQVSVVFAFDPASGEAVPAEDPFYGALPVTMIFRLLDSSFLSTGQISPFNSCAVILAAPGSVAPNGQAEALGQWATFDMPANATVFDDCADYVLPAGLDDAGAAIASWQWGFGVGDLPDETRDEIEAQATPAEWAALEPLIIGSLVTGDLLEATIEGGVLPGIAQAGECDENFLLVTDPLGERQALEAEQTWDGTSLALGVYYLDSGFIQGAAQLLAQ